MPEGGRKSVNNQDIASSLANSDSFLTDLVYCSEYDTFYLWDNYYFTQLDTFKLHHKYHHYIAKTFPRLNITESLINDVVKSSRYYINIIHETPDFSRIAFLDNNFNLDSFEFEPHNKQKLTVFNFPHNSQDINMPTPNWHNFLKTSLVKANNGGTDQELIDFVQEMFGYFLLPSLKGSSAFFLVGDGSNGKSVMVKVLEEMFGRDYCSHMSIQSLTTDKFKSSGLVGKKINISNEEESKFMRADTFKALITGDTITGERKFGDSFSFTPNTKFVFATNEMPTFDTMNYGLRRRMKFIPFFRRFLDNEQDKNLIDKLVKEIPGIIGWAIEGAKRFVYNDRVFKQAAASIQYLEKFVEEISSALSFFNNFYIIDNSLKTANNDVYNHYKKWCEDNGRKPMNSHNFWRDINKEFGDTIMDLRWNEMGNPERIRGKNIGLKGDYEETPASEITVESIPF